MKPHEELFPEETIEMLPINHQFITKKSYKKNGVKIRFGKCSYYNAEEYTASPFYKPISRAVDHE